MEACQPRRRGSQNHRCATKFAGTLLLVGAVLGPSRCGERGPPAVSDVDASNTVHSSLHVSGLGLLERTDPPPDRTEMIVLSQRLEAMAQGIGATGSGAAFKMAADLRARSWRVAHVANDARDAVRLYAAALDSGNLQRSEACWAMLVQSELAAALSRDPRAYFRGAYIGSRVFTEGPCARAMMEATTLLSAYAASKEETRELEAESARRRAALFAPALPAAPSTGADSSTSARRPGQSEASPRILSVAPYSSVDRARVVVTLSGATAFELGASGADTERGRTRREGARLFLDLPHVVPGRHDEIRSSGLVQGLRELPHGNGTRIVLELASSAYRRVFSLLAPFRIVVDVASQSTHSDAVSHKRRPVARLVLDPGHGGVDPGAIGSSGLKEKDVTLDIAHRAAPILSRELGIATMLTRDGDRTISLDERMARANAFHADLFVSIHCNASDSPGARGVMTFVLDSTRDELAARIAARENATNSSESDGNASIEAAQPAGADESRRLANLLQRATLASLYRSTGEANDLGVRTAGFFVLMGAEMPAVLYETSFISNAAEERKLATGEYRQKLADAIVNAVRAFREGR